MFGILGLDLGEAARHAARAQAALHRLLKRIVAAGIEDHEPQFFYGIENAHDAVERHRLVFDVDVTLEPGVDRQQIVGAVDLDAVSGVVDDRDVGIARLVGEIAHHPAHVGVADVLLRVHDIEPRLPQHVGHRRRVPGRVGQPGDVLIGGITDHQRDAFVGERRRCLKNDRQENCKGR